MSTIKSSLFVGVAALAVGATNVRAEPKLVYVPSTEQTENTALACIQKNMGKNPRFSDVKGEVVADAGLAQLNGANAIAYFAKVTGTVANRGKTSAFEVTTAAAYDVPAAEITVAPSAEKLNLANTSDLTRVDAGSKKDHLILRAFNYSDAKDTEPSNGPISKNANPDQVDAGALVGEAVVPCIKSPRYVPAKLAR